jgi:predicted transcriptional regulator
VDVAQRRGHGDLAQEILNLVGRAGTQMTPGQVRHALDRRLAYTTVMTVMTRLHGRGLLARQRIGRAFAYTALGDPAAVTAGRMHRLLDIERDHAEVLACFVDGLNVDDERLLRGLLHALAADHGGANPAGPRGPSTARDRG